MNIDLGCGPNKKKGYFGVDLEPGKTVDMVCDVTKELPFENESVEKIYSSHFFEHLPKSNVIPILRQCYRVLRTNGTIEIIVPSLEHILKAFLLADENSRWENLLDFIYGNQVHEGEFHKTGFTIDRILKQLSLAGFKPLCAREIWDHGIISIHSVAIKTTRPVTITVQRLVKPSRDGVYEDEITKLIAYYERRLIFFHRTPMYMLYRGAMKMLKGMSKNN